MKFSVKGEVYDFADDQITFRDGRDLERVTGVKFDENGMADFVHEAGLAGFQAIVWIAMRKKDPELKFSDVDDLPIASIQQIEEPDPTEGDEKVSNGEQPSQDPSSPSTSESDPVTSSL